MLIILLVICICRIEIQVILQIPDNSYRHNGRTAS